MANRQTLLARLIGHAFGDGNIHKNKRYFSYINSNKQMQREVENIVRNIFGKVSLCKVTSISGTPIYQYSNKVGKYLADKGAPVGSKVLQEIQIPKWIESGNTNIKSAFLGAVFDDEGYFRDSPKCRQIVFKAAKCLKLKRNLEEYLGQLISILESLNIETSGIRSDQIKKNKGGTEMISLRFWITKSENFHTFQKRIEILHSEKKKKLNNILLLSPAG